MLALTFGGFRFGEAIALRRQDVTPDGAWLTVSRPVRYVYGRWLVGDPKTDAGRRTVSLPASVGRCTQRPPRPTRPPRPRRLVFGTSAGTFLHSANFGVIFRRAVERAPSAAALMYQHSADERDSEIARALDAMIDGGASSAQRASPDAPERGVEGLLTARSTDV